MLYLFSLAEVKVPFLVVLYVFNFKLLGFSAAILEKLLRELNTSQPSNKAIENFFRVYIAFSKHEGS